MKRRLLFAMLCIVSALGMRAQLTEGTVYWIQDVATGQFISQGGNWGTQATVQDVGGIGFEAVPISEGVYKLKNIQWNKVNSADLGLNIVEHDGYCDQSASSITLTASGDGYKLSAVKGSDTRYLINNQTENDYGVKGLGFTTDASAATVWKFLDKDGYDAAIQAYKDAKAASYATALGKTAANVAELENLIANEYIPKDYTSSITNAALNAGNTDGWTASKPNQRDQAFGSENGTMAESWNGCVVATQTVSNLPNGLYKVSFVGTFRPKGSTESARLESNQTSSPAYVFANDSKEEFIHWIDVPAKANNRTGMKNNAAAYTSNFYTYVTDGTLNIGVKQDTWYNGSMWCPFGYFTLTYYTDQVSDEDITALFATIPAEETVPAGVYSNLTSLKNTLETTKTIVAYNNLSSAVTEANALVAPYAILVTEISKAKALGIDAATADGYANVTTAAQATANTQALMVAEYNYVATTYKYAVDLGTWNASPNSGTMSSQHWDGTSTSTYLEQGGGNLAYNQPSWTVTYDQNLNLPAGNYVFKVAGRTAADHVTINLNVTNVSNSDELLGTVNDFPKGDVGLGINKAGATSFDPNDAAGFANNGIGRGWQWRYVKFTLTEAATVKVAVVANADAQYRWMGFCNATVQTDTEANISLIAYNIALNDAKLAKDNSDYENVTGTERAELLTAIDADETLDKTNKSAIDAAKDNLVAKTSAFTGAKGAYDAYVAAKAVEYPNLAYATTAKRTALDDAQSADDATSASDADTKTAAILTAARKYYESHALAEKVEDAVDMTELIIQANAPASFDAIEGWTVTDNVDNTNSTINSNEQFTQGDGTLGGAYYDGGDLWGKSAYTANYKQEIQLEPGKYLLTVTSRASQDTKKFELYAGENKLEMLKIGAAIGTGVFDRGWNDQSLEFEIDRAQNVEIGVNIEQDKEHNWYSFTRFRLVQLEKAEGIELATPEDYANLNAAIEAAEAKTLGFDEGEYAPYNNVVALQAVAAAKAIDQEAENSQEDVQAATAAITNATWTANTAEVNAFYDGTFANAENNGAPKGWTMSNNTLGGDYHSRAFVGDSRLAEFNETNSGFFMRFDGTNSNRGSMYYYGNTENYTMPLKENVTYYAKVDFTNWGTTNSKPLRMNVTGPEGFTGIGLTVNSVKNADSGNDAPDQIVVVFTATVSGNYTINFQCPGSDDNKHNVLISNCELFRADEVTMSIKANKYGTFIAPFDVTIPADVKAYGISAMDGTDVVLAEVETTIPANTPVVVENTTAVAISETFAGKSTATEDSYTVGYLTGVYTATKIPVGAYVLQTQNGKQAFYKVESDNFTATPNRAYLSVPAGQSEGVKAFYLGGDTDGISSLVNDLQNGDIYDLAGRKVQRMQKGNVYIVNGRKVVIK